MDHGAGNSLPTLFSELSFLEIKIKVLMPENCPFGKERQVDKTLQNMVSSIHIPSI